VPSAVDDGNGVLVTLGHVGVATAEFGRSLSDFVRIERT
jgi:hypothetical protein